jgi:glutamyl-tRNA synthetase
LEPTLSYTIPALEQLQLPGVSAALAAVATALLAEDVAVSSVDSLKGLTDHVAKAEGIKKGVLLKSLRAALTGDLQGPDLMESFLLLHQRGWAMPRLQAAATLVKPT